MENDAVESQEPILFDDDIDIGFLLKEFSDDFDFDFEIPNSTPDDSNSSSPKEPEAPAFGAIEKLLMDDDNEVVGLENADNLFADEFFAGIFSDGFGSGSGSDNGKCEVATSESRGSASSEAEKEKGSDFVVIDGEEGEEDEQSCRKRRRQLRNRDSATKSRERKKIYVKDLELKSKYLESECRRLDYALRFYMAENVALHQCLQSGRPLGASAAKQESAVLFVESLLLGSLLWLVSIMCLFLMPSLQSSPNLKGASILGRGLALEGAGPKQVACKTPGADMRVDLIIMRMRRRCRSMKTRMKSYLFPLHVISA